MENPSEINFVAALDQGSHSASLAPEAVLGLLNQWYSVISMEGERISVLNQAVFLLSHPKYREPAWQFYRERAAEAGRTADETLQIQLKIALFEMIAEPPVIERDVQMLFTLLDSVETRWAVFAAYERYPRTFRRHIGIYAQGRISDAEFHSWIDKQDLVYTDRGLRRKWVRGGFGEGKEGESG